MRKLLSILVAAVVLLSVNACNRTKSNQNNQPQNSKETINYITVDDVVAKGESLSGKTVNVEGFIEDVCKHTWKRFKLIGKNKNQFIKVELGDKFPSVDTTIIGKKAKVSGKLVLLKMDTKMVQKWEKKVRETHKGEEDTEHFKKEIKFIQNIQNQIKNGEIPYYTNYTIEAETYELE